MACANFGMRRPKRKERDRRLVWAMGALHFMATIPSSNPIPFDAAMD
ncbi:MAG TPA: hypothetical protein VFW89_09875 [Gemmatimonadaceae bacterium]|nr:hypothetical protein [Gemmatimonadaceae bacterium]